MSTTTEDKPALVLPVLEWGPTDTGTFVCCTEAPEVGFLLISRNQKGPEFYICELIDRTGDTSHLRVAADRDLGQCQMKASVWFWAVWKSVQLNKPPPPPPVLPPEAAAALRKAVALGAQANAILDQQNSTGAPP